MTLLMLAGGLAPEEIVRERIRKPWIAGEYLYANQIIGKDVPALGIKNELSLIAEKGVLKTHPVYSRQSSQHYTGKRSSGWSSLGNDTVQ